MLHEHRKDKKYTGGKPMPVGTKEKEMPFKKDKTRLQAEGMVRHYGKGSGMNH